MTEKKLGQISDEARQNFFENVNVSDFKTKEQYFVGMEEFVAQTVIEAHEARKWQPIETAPQDDGVSFLVLLSGNECCKSLTLQVQKFEGRMYPDHLDFNVDGMDIVTGATHWQPLPAQPKTESEQ